MMTVYGAAQPCLVGTVCRISQDGFALSALHVLSERGQFLPATAWGKPLKNGQAAYQGMCACRPHGAFLACSIVSSAPHDCI